MSKTKLLTIGFLMMGALLFAGISEPINQSKFIPDTSNEYKPQALASSFTDGKAIISNVTGTAKILRSGSDEWVPVGENDTLQEGDQIRTDNNASVDVVYDDSSLNVTHIDQNTIAKFTSLEPTRIYLSDGSVFSSLEALPKGQEYEVATDTSVNAIRGTKFLRTYEAKKKTDSTVVADGSVQSFSVMPDGSKSEESVFVSKDNTLTLTPELLHKTPFSKLQPVLSSVEHQKEIDGLEKGVQKHLEDSSGGPDALKAHREHVLVTMKQPEFREAFQEKQKEMAEKRRQALMEKGGPNAALQSGPNVSGPEQPQGTPHQRLAPGPGPATGGARPPRPAPKTPGDRR